MRGFEVTAASGAASARTLLQGVGPDGALIDQHLGSGENGLALLAGLRASDAALPLALLTGEDPRAVLGSVGRLDVVLFCKPASPAQLEVFLRRVWRHFEERRSFLDDLDGAERLSEWERDVLDALLGGDAYAEAARRLGISARTVDSYARRALCKLGITMDELRCSATEARWSRRTARG